MGPTGFIPPWQRTQEQHDAHEAAVATMPRMTLTRKPMSKGEKVLLTRAWKAPEVVADVGFEFNRFHQITGSCFLSGTKVSMADGATKYIEDIKAGEIVLTHKGRPKRVLTPTTRKYTGNIYSICGISEREGYQLPKVKVTADHTFLVKTVDDKEEWIQASSLNGHSIFHNENVYKVDTNTSIDRVTNTSVYCLKVEEDESFIANGYKVHNCVGAGGGNALFTLIAIQRLFAENPTVAFIPWWCFNYGRSRLYAGMRNPGEGSFGSTFFKSLVQDGVMNAATQGLPQFSKQDGLMLTRSIELQWSDGDERLVTQYMNIAKEHPIGASSQVKTIDQVAANIQNGYPLTIACNNNISMAQIIGSGEDACVVGRWNNYGPHQQSIHDLWEHPNLGPLYYVMNNWPGSTYPRDPAGGPICGCWVKERDVEVAMRLDAELFALSNLTWFPAQSKVMEYFA